MEINDMTKSCSIIIDGEAKDWQIMMFKQNVERWVMKVIVFTS